MFRPSRLASFLSALALAVSVSGGLSSAATGPGVQPPGTASPAQSPTILSRLQLIPTPTHTSPLYATGRSPAQPAGEQTGSWRFVRRGRLDIRLGP
jgi:hypothetical protein